MQEQLVKLKTSRMTNLYPCLVIISFNLPARCSHDVVCNERGKDLIDLCISSDLQILNGKIFGDYSGKFTFFQYNGNSVVDYCLISNSFARSVLYFYVNEHLPILSDHARLTVHIDCLFEEVFVPSLDQCTYMPHQYVWNKNSQYLFYKPLTTQR